MLAISQPSSPLKSTQIHTEQQWDLTCRNNTREAISDICFLGMPELLDLAGDPKSGNGFDLFIRGIIYDPEDCEKEEMVHLDITRDAIPTENVPIYISVDIGSLIWKTHHLHLKASINIHMAPYIQPKPPINTHNRTYVNLIKPQTDIHSILHIHFGHLQGGINVWIAFPRMTHKQQDSPYFATQIPLLVQDHWFAFILIPAIKKIYGRGSKEYVNHSPQEYNARAAGKTETRLVDQIKLQELQDQIDTIIHEDEDEDLHIFGSFFFIMDIRGIKLTNKDRDHLGNAPFEVLADVIPALDFHYMFKPENGECVIDLGISAGSEADQPMVGLWNLTKVDASFAQAGTNTPYLFNVGTLADYGAVSAEYPIDCASVLQMRYHMAYNLIFEIVHGNIQFPENSDAYAANSTFHAHINQIVNLYRDAKQSSYGVRDEL
ncbi:hypothetical protein M422DRAFT_273046 [Sphaerobolus stellatus SS14]|uniref:Uncharacterized protein n=1 Tax=Sphaerobolus stellatus (strain SS14) TaxID=990650 RepID=A0A0C9UL69_SPHS4|nr:hypothetical protein M422DRAFT_273046 [Sphaerobolus stellatus SS14]